MMTRKYFPWSILTILFSITAPFFVHAESITQTSEFLSPLTAKAQSFLNVVTSKVLPEDPNLGLQSSALGYTLFAKLRNEGLQVHVALINRYDEIDKEIAAAVEKCQPTYILSITVPKGIVSNMTVNGTKSSVLSTFQAIAAIRNPNTNSVIWKTVLDVRKGLIFGASTKEVAEAIFERMKRDGVIPTKPITLDEKVSPPTVAGCVSGSINKVAVQPDAKIATTPEPIQNQHANPSLLNTKLRTEYPPTQFAVIDNVDAVPYISNGCRVRYREWLTKQPPKAFVVGPENTGNCGFSWGTTPPQPDLPTDPVERAVLACEKFAKASCKIYAIDNHIVWKP